MNSSGRATAGKVEIKVLGARQIKKVFPVDVKVEVCRVCSGVCPTGSQ